MPFECSFLTFLMLFKNLSLSQYSGVEDYNFLGLFNTSGLQLDKILVPLFHELLCAKIVSVKEIF